MHKQVKEYCEGVKRRFPDLFVGKDVLDCGSLDINGNNRYLFTGGSYTGIDIVNGRNVDIISRVHEFDRGKQYDVIISTEMLEHDKYYDASLAHMRDLLKSGGLLIITAAGNGRALHGTADHHPADSPLTHDHYKNIEPSDIVENLRLYEFSLYEISGTTEDIRFFGIKR